MDVWVKAGNTEELHKSLERGYMKDPWITFIMYHTRVIFCVEQCIIWYMLRKARTCLYCVKIS